MDRIEIDPWQKKNINALQAYRVDGTLYTVPYVISSDLTLKKTKDKYAEECRRLPLHYRKRLKLNMAVSLEKSIKLEKKVKTYLQESSSQHMTTIMDGIEEAKLHFDKADFLVAAETLNKIAGSVFNQERSWKLRAFVEEVRGKRMIVLCDDDLEDGAPPIYSMEFAKEREESGNFSQQLCEEGDEGNPNRHLHGCLAVQSSLGDGSNSVDMIVLGEIDMVADHQPAISSVVSGIKRNNCANFCYDEEGMIRSFDYLWSRSFWLGLGVCFFGLRTTDTEDVSKVQKFSLYEFYRQHRHRDGKLADVAISCVARVLLRLRKAINSNPRANWIVEYEGRDYDVEPDNIKIREATDSFSFWLIREKYHLKRIAEIHKRSKKENDEVPPRKVRKFQQKSGLKRRITSGPIAAQLQSFMCTR